MVGYLKENDFINIREINLIVPVPLFKGDYLKRGFNQSGLLAKHIADYFSIPFTDCLLIKKIGNLSQVGLSKKERENNVKHVYSIDPSCEMDFASILLIDDIYTTGATAEACCRELRKTGLKKLFVLTLARGI